MARWFRHHKAPFAVGLASLVLLALQLGLPAVVPVGKVAPELVLALVVSVSLCQGSLWGIPLALVLGFVTDSLTGWGLGLHMLTYALAAGVSGLYELRQRADTLWVAPAVSAIGVIVARLAAFIVLYVSRVAVPVAGITLYRLAVSILLTGAVSFALHPWLYRQVQPVLEDRFSRAYRKNR